MSTSESEYEVDEIIAKRVVNGVPEYKVKWRGYEGQNTWEPATNLSNVRNLIDAFERKANEVQTISDSEMTEEVPEEEGHYDRNDSV